MDSIIVSVAVVFFKQFADMPVTAWKALGQGVKDLRVGLTLACATGNAETAAEMVSAGMGNIKSMLREIQAGSKVPLNIAAENTETVIGRLKPYGTALVWALESGQFSTLHTGEKIDEKTCARISTAYQKHLEVKKIEKGLESNAKQKEKLENAKKGLHSETSALVADENAANAKAEIEGARAFAKWLDTANNSNGANLAKVEKWIADMQKDSLEFATPMVERQRNAA